MSIGNLLYLRFRVRGRKENAFVNEIVIIDHDLLSGIKI